MIRKTIVLIVLGILLNIPSYACDVCGCSISGTGLGLVSAYRYNFISMSWQLTPFEGSRFHGAGSYDQFHTLELSMRYHFTTDFKLLVHQPYKLNFRNTNDELSNLEGIGDTRILANYTILRDKKIGGVNLYMELGAGAQLPVGKYDSNLHSKDLPENFNIGKGTWSFIFQPNIILNKNNFGLIMNGTYQRNAVSKSGYQFGNQVSGQALFYYRKDLKNELALTPYLGILGESIAQDHFDDGALVSGTSGKGLFLTTGINLKWKSLLFSTAYTPPLSQMYSLNEVSAKSRYMGQISFIF